MLRSLLAALLAPAALAVAAPAASAIVDFRTPDRAAYCGTTHSPGVPHLLCWTPNDGFTVSMSARGRATKHYSDSNRGYHDPVAGHGVLRFGESIRLAGSYRCTSRKRGLTCTNAAGYGWWLGRFSGYRLLAPSAEPGRPVPPGSGRPAPTAPERPAPPARLGTEAAKRDVRSALAYHFEQSWTGADSRRIDCARLSPRLLRCAVSWYIGDAAFRGTVRARRADGRRSVYGTVKTYDQYCIHVTRTGNCVTATPVYWSAAIPRP